MKDQAVLRQLYHELSSYMIVNCKLRHEQITGISAPVTEHDLLEHLINRVGFCDKQFRQHALNCAHTIAPYRFNELLLKFANEAGIPEEQLLFNQMNDLLTKIYKSDHQKGFAEKEYASLKHQDGDMQSIASAKDAIDRITRKHSEYVSQLKLLHLDLMQLLATHLADYDVTSFVLQ